MTSRPSPVLPQALPDLATLRTWVGAGAGPRATIYLPLQRSFPESQQNAVQLDHAARELEQRLAAAGVPDPGAWAARLRGIETDVRRLGAWPAALAALLDAGAQHVVGLHAATPFRVTLASSFALRPLLGALRRASRYRVLAVSAGRVALFEGGPEGVGPEAIPGLPQSLEDALGSETTEKELRMRGTRAGGGAPVFYSHGDSRDQRKLDLARFHEALGRALAGHLGDGALPMVLFASDEHQAGLRAAAKIPVLIAEGVEGNPDRLSPAELHAAAWPLVERWLGVREQAGWERARNRGKGVDLLDDVGAAAVAGRVRRLWIDAARSIAGRIDPETGRVVAGGGDDDVLDALAEIVVARGGEVIPVAGSSLPSGTGAAAELH